MPSVPSSLLRPRLALTVVVIGVLTVIWFPPWRGNAFLGGYYRSGIHPRVSWSAGIHPLTTPPRPSNTLSSNAPAEIIPETAEYHIDSARLAIHLVTLFVLAFVIGLVPLPTVRIPRIRLPRPRFPRIRIPTVPFPVIAVLFSLVSASVIAVMWVTYAQQARALRDNELKANEVRAARQRDSILAESEEAFRRRPLTPQGTVGSTSGYDTLSGTGGVYSLRDLLGNSPHPNTPKR